MSAAHRFDLDRLGDGLVVSGAEPELTSAIRAGAAVVSAPPGTGKTTFVPPLVANLLPAGRVVVTQPRRVAVRAAARRIAELDASAVGGPVGFTVRGERAMATDTRIELLTPGVLLRRLLRDPGLDGVAAVVLDEVHERSVDADLLLGMVAEVRALRDDLVVVAMSATVDTTAVARLLGTEDHPAAVVELPWALHPLTIEHRPPAGPRLDARGVSDGFLDHLATITVEAQAEDRTDALVFVPGAREVDALVRRLSARTTGVDVLPLHGRLPARDQDRAVRGRSPDDPPRIVVSTAIAESSLTVPGVRLVIDACLSREVRRDRARDMTGLVTVSASRASAEQRAGRAARLGPGRAVRALSETDFARLPAVSVPEITAADLTDTALLLAVWGAPGGEGLPLLTPPPAESMALAITTVATLGLVDDTGRATELGQRVAGMPIGVREARALLSAPGEPRQVAEVVAAISDDHREPGADLSRLLRELRSARHPGHRRWQREVQRLARIAGEERIEPAVDIEFSPGAVLALARPERIARRAAPDSRSYLFASGTRAAVPEGSALLGHEWLAVWEVQRGDGRVADGTGAVVRLAAPLAEDDAVRLGGSLLTQERKARLEDGRVQVRHARRLGAITLSSTPAAAGPDDIGPALVSELAERGPGLLDWSEAADGLRRRLSLLHATLGDPWPAVDDAAIVAAVTEQLSLSPPRSAKGLAQLDLVAILRGLLPWPEATRLNELVPQRLAVPSGSSVRIDYPPVDDPTASPVVAVKVQEVFGLAETPRLVDGRVPVLFHLLSPARRPLAVTADLESFWNGPYAEVRKQMRGRYPKHPWPEDPWTAAATARTKGGHR
ncbi:MAG TPA: ATP-dependent helicase HrpB [Candidatus Avipropionibacterium avicola]|uniref:ATP-dependent helicase HrpB n=1 Tax=Candidatus Avipropionibacterium avicola TaxID=2840701 RepID=A0A9D1KP15_9ACTN|nr:ATP-dependent helicase HrpB [Candidatus Avipropionibacterium avicola]